MSVYTIPPSQPFVDSLARGILDQVGDAPQSLASVHVLLPTRRACRSLREAFLRLSDGKPMLLPVMLPLGDVDEDELALEGVGVEDSLDLPPAIGAMTRITQLARFVMAMDPDTTPDQAVRLAEELARLVDQVHTEGLDLASLPDLVKDEELSKHWEKTVKFLSIVGDTWPKVLADKGVLDPAKRRDMLLRARATSWAQNPPSGPVFAAGSTGTIPATSDLLTVIANLDKGAVVLPGLDLNAADDVWGNLEPSHPQYGMARLLEKLSVTRADVALWPKIESADDPRQRLVQRALVPAEATHLWRDHPLSDADIQQSLDGMVRVDCPGPREEAGAIALILRQALEDKDQTAAFITPDRQLARRVAVELGRWNVDVDDSAGLPLDQTPPGAFFNLVAQMAADGFHPVSVLACLKHPLAAGGVKPHALRTDVRALEAACLRGPRPAKGLDGLEARHRVFRHDPEGHAEKRLVRMGFDANAPRSVLNLLDTVMQPLTDALGQTQADPCELLKLHAAAAEALARTDAAEDERLLWAHDAGEALSTFVAEAHDALSDLGPISAEQYPALIKALMAGRAVRPRYTKHPRVFIWGLLEARLQRADVTVLGGLNEGSWPPESDASPWMSRPMMRAFGLPLPERRTGLAAHDFVQAAAAPRVYLTRAERSGTSPQTLSRWLVRLDTMLGETKMAREPKWLDWARDLTRPEGKVTPCLPPKPTPPVTTRPRQLSVTAIEKWIRDPYSIYAQYVLGLRPLDDIDADASAADRGMVVHDILERFVKANMESLPDDPVAELLKIGEVAFKENIASPGVRAFWWPRFKRIAVWFADFESKRRAAGFVPVLVEDKGQTELDGFTLTAKADRMDVDVSGGLVIMDYKTGQAPTTKQVACGLTPQLPLEGLIAQRGGFPGVAKEHPVANLVYVRLTGGRAPGKEKPVKLDGVEAVQAAFEGLTKLIHKFNQEDTPYLSRPRAQFLSRFGDFDHLGRVKEWSGEGEGGGE